MGSNGRLRILERRMARLVAEAEAVLARLEERQQWHEQMETLDRQRDACEASPSQNEASKAAGELATRIEKLRQQAEAARIAAADWVERARRLVLEGAQLEPRLLQAAEKAHGLRLGWERGPEQIQLVVLRARSVLLEALACLQPPQLEKPEIMIAPPDGTQGKGLMTVKEAAALLAVSAKKLYRMAALGRVPHVRLGRSLRFRREDLERWLGQQAVYPRRR